MMLFFGSVLSAQESPVPYLMHWTDQDGLCDNTIYALHEDQHGMLWIGSLSGLCRFDGKDFEFFQYEPDNKSTLPSNEIVEIIETPDGRIWVGTDGGGLSVYDYTNNEFTSLRQGNDSIPLSLTEDRTIRVIQNQAGEIVVGYRAIGSGKGGLSILTEDLEIKSHGARDAVDYAGFPIKVSEILQDPEEEDVYWLAGRSFFRWQRSTDELLEFPHTAFKPSYTSVYGILDVSETSLLVGFPNGGVWLFDKQHMQWCEEVHPIPVRDMYRAETGAVWISDDIGIGYFVEDFTSVNYVVYLTGENSPFSDGVVVNNIELSGNKLWIGTDEGLFCWSTLFRQFSVNSFLYPDGELAYIPEFIGKTTSGKWLFIDQQNGLLLTDSIRAVKKSIAMPAEVHPRKGILVEKQNGSFVMLGGERGLYQWEIGTDQIIPYRPKHASLNTDEIQVWSFYQDDFDQLWIGTRTSGLLKLNLKTNELSQFLHHQEDSLSLCHDKFLFEIDEDTQGNLWVATDKGVSIINPQSSTFLSYPNLTAIQNYVVHCIEADNDGNFWIGTRDQGLFKYKLENGQLTNFNTIHGLPYNGINEMALADSLLWMSTRQGLCRINIYNHKMVTYDRKKGLLDNTLYNSRLKVLPDGKLMLSYEYSYYYSVFESTDLQDYHPKPKIRFKSLRVLTATISDTRIVTASDTVFLNYKENYFVIDFQATDFLEARSLQYEYILAGYDQNWIKSGKNNTATYSNLPGGDYVLNVRATNRDGQQSEAQKLFIHLQTAWYKTTWFYGLLALTVAWVAYLVYSYRMRQIRREEDFKRQLAETEMKALRAQINPHFIFNCLNSIKSYIIENKIEDGTAFVGKFSQLIRMILNHSKERLIPFSKEIEAIQLYTWLEHQRLKGKFSIDYELDFNTSAERLLVPPLLFQPYIENAIWHGLLPMEEEGRLVVSILELDKTIQIEILDDGIGRKTAQKLKSQSAFSKPSMGLDITSKRLEQINALYAIDASVKIEDLYPNRAYTGTRVTILFPKLSNSQLINT